MAKATGAQYDTAIANYRRTAEDFRKTAAIWPEGNWRKDADLRVAAKADANADVLQRMKDAVAQDPMPVLEMIR